MQIRMLRGIAPVFVLATCLVGFASVAHAQIGQMDPSQFMQRHAHEAEPGTVQPKVSQPPALPGAESRAGGAAPASQLPTDMAPNDALFDAINRGDITAARDAVSRGADMGAHNVLGMTPMELSVDLGRNDISFLLLSYRGADDSRRPPAQAASATPAALAKPVPAKAAGHATASQAKGAVPAAAQAAPQTPRLFANDGGAPVPGVGFLGFDTGRSTR